MNRGDYQKNPLATSFNRTAQQAAATAIQQFGKALPCSVVAVNGQIVKVKFEVTGTATIPQAWYPIATSKYAWLPIQIGDTGVTQPADTYLGGISGLGGGIASSTQRTNLTALVFVPIANSAWTVPNVNQHVIQGPQGVLIQTTAGDASVNVTSAAITAICQGHTLIINSAGITLDGILWDTHYHSDPQGGDTGPPL